MKLFYITLLLLLVSSSVQALEICFVGDIMLGRNVELFLINNNYNLYVAKEIAEYLKSSDYIMGNLESPITAFSADGSNKYPLCCGPENISILNLYKINIVSLANNHCWDSGKKGLEECKNILKSNSIESVSSDHELNINNNDIKVVIIVEYILENMCSKNLLSKIDKLNKNTDIIVVYLHWGEEYKSKPELWQVKLAHRLIDSGADLIIGSHPHVLQSTENYKNKYIFYSLGNFIFDQTQIDTLDSQIIKLNISREKIIHITTLPIKRNLFFPEYRNDLRK